MLAEEPMKVAIIGLGYVGLTLGVALASRGVRVFGVETRRDIVELTAAGKPHFSEKGLDVALAAVVNTRMLTAAISTTGMPAVDYYIITVGTPLKPGTHEPRLDMIENAARQVAGHLQDGATVVLRSTVRIGTT